MAGPAIWRAAALALVGACSHAQTACPRGATLARRVYTGGVESEWCRRDADHVRQGVEIRYYESGVKLLEGIYVEGVQHGLWRYYWKPARCGARRPGTTASWYRRRS